MSVFRQGLVTGPLQARLAENVPRRPYETPLLVAQVTEDTIILLVASA